MLRTLIIALCFGSVLLVGCGKETEEPVPDAVPAPSNEGGPTPLTPGAGGGGGGTAGEAPSTSPMQPPPPPDGG